VLRKRRRMLRRPGGTRVVRKNDVWWLWWGSCTRHPPLVATEKVVPPTGAEAGEVEVEAENSGGPLGTTLSEIDRIIVGVVFEMEMDEVTAAEATTSKMKEIEETSSESKDLDLRYLGGQ
jgi:hypothetical protein